jgi:hypothetical protein
LKLSRRWFLLLAASLGIPVLLTGCGGGSSSSNNVTVNPVSISPANPSMGTGANLQFTATIDGSPTTAVNWQVNGTTGGSSSVGIITTAGLYIAPASPPGSGSINVTAVNQAASSQSASTTVTLLPIDPLGTTANVSTISCPASGLSGGTCYSFNVSCPAVADATVYLKVVPAAGAAKGTVVFGTGGGDVSLYDAGAGGHQVVLALQQAGFTTVQLSFDQPFTSSVPNGWLTGPGGVRRLACRYATTVQWIYTNIHNSNTGAPLCATGNSGGAAEIAYALAHYGLDSILAMVEPTSGPPMARIDYGCVCNGGSLNTPCGQGAMKLCYGPATAAILDTAYSAPICTQALTGDTTNQAQFLSDSVADPGANFAYPRTAVNIVFGGKDTSSAVPQGLEWFNAITSNNGPPPPVCVADAPHEITAVPDGAAQIANDLINMCKLQ